MKNRNKFNRQGPQRRDEEIFACKPFAREKNSAEGYEAGTLVMQQF